MGEIMHNPQPLQHIQNVVGEVALIHVKPTGTCDE